jgi:hypothetical protein
MIYKAHLPDSLITVTLALSYHLSYGYIQNMWMAFGLDLWTPASKGRILPKKYLLVQGPRTLRIADGAVQHIRMPGRREEGAPELLHDLI